MERAIHRSRRYSTGGAGALKQAAHSALRMAKKIGPFATKRKLAPLGTRTLASAFIGTSASLSSSSDSHCYFWSKKSYLSTSRALINEPLQCDMNSKHHKVKWTSHSCRSSRRSRPGGGMVGDGWRLYLFFEKDLRMFWGFFFSLFSSAWHTFCYSRWDLKYKYKQTDIPLFTHGF